MTNDLKNKQDDCGAANIGAAISTIWADIETNNESIDQNMRLFQVYKSNIEMEPVKSFEGLLTKLLLAKDTIEDVFSNHDECNTCWSGRENSLNLLLNDSIRFIELQSGTSVESLGLAIFYEPNAVN